MKLRFEHEAAWRRASRAVESWIPTAGGAFAFSIYRLPEPLKTWLTTGFLKPVGEIIQSNPIVVYIAGGLIAVIILSLVIYKVLGRLTGSGGGAGAVKTQLKRAIKKKNWDLVLELAHPLNDHESLAIAYENMENHLRAARSYREAGVKDKAVELFERAGAFEEGAKLLADMEQWERAAEFYSRAEKWSSAGELYEKAQNLDMAGKMYEKASMFRQAYDMFKASNNNAGAAHVLEMLLAEEKSGTGGNISPKKRQQLEAIAQRSAEFYLKSGEIEKAARVLDAAGLAAPAAKLYLKAGVNDKAATLFLDAGQMLDAASVYEQMGDTLRANQLRGEYHRSQGENIEAAKFFDQAALYTDAASCYKAADEPGKAAEMFVKERSWESAADMFIKAGQLDRAAQALENGRHFREAAQVYAKAGQHEKQAESLSRGGEHYAAGEIFHKLKRFDEAIVELQKVDADTLDFRKASAKLGDIFLQQEKAKLAIAKLRQAVGADEVTKANISVFFNLAMALMANEEPEEALRVFERIQVCDLNYKDLGTQMAKAQEAVAKLATAKPASPAGTTPGEGVTQMLAPPKDDRYEILEELGRGGMGIVYKAADKMLSREVAYKILPDNSGNPESPAVKNFLREAQSAAALQHPNIVTIFDVGSNQSVYYIIMEYVEGKTLKSFFNGNQRLSEKAIVMIAKQICKGLAFAHSKRIIHRDIKSANIMLTADKTVKIMDFGLAKAVEGMADTQTVVRGTPLYMAPEQILGQKLDMRADLYSFGICLFEMATGRLPYEKGDVGYHHVHTAFPDPRKLNPKLSDEMAAIITRCCEKDRLKRFQSAKDVFDALNAVKV